METISDVCCTTGLALGINASTPLFSKSKGPVATPSPCLLASVWVVFVLQGASKGEGMGNKFLSNIRECDAIVHVVRCFEDENVIHVSGQVDPVSDMAQGGRSPTAEGGGLYCHRCKKTSRKWEFILNGIK